MQDRIEKEILIEAPVAVVWQMITEPEHLNGWFTDANEIELRPGGPGSMTWGERAATKADKKPGDEFVAHLQVIDVDEPKRFSFRWGQSAGETPTPTNSLMVEFLLEAQGEHTRLYVIESGMQELAWPEVNKVTYIQEHETGWRKHLTDLRDYTLDSATRN